VVPKTKGGKLMCRIAVRLYINDQKETASVAEATTAVARSVE
jgi:hypothetical protein